MLWFIKIRFNTHDNIGSGPISIPPMEMHTSATWLSFEQPENWNEEELTDALTGVAYALESFIPLFIHCDRTDVSVVPQVKATHNEKPTLFIYDSYPGGIGLSERIYDYMVSLLERTIEHVELCPCHAGCPACIGAQEAFGDNKMRALHILRSLKSEMM